MKQLANDYGAWTAGASWQVTNPVGNTMSQEVVNFINGSGITLYTGDVVVVGTSAATPDPTATNVTTTATAQSPYVVGVVGGETNMAYAGGAIPSQTPPTSYFTTTTTASATVNDTTAVATDVGKGVFGPGIPAGAYILSVTPGTSFVMNVAATAGGPFSFSKGPRISAVGPGWLSVPVGSVCPVVIQGWAYVNIGAATVAAGATLSTAAIARQAAVAGTPTLGCQIGTALEAQNGAGVITSGDGSASVLVRAWITKA